MAKVIFSTGGIGVSIDNGDFPLVMSRKWYINKNGYVASDKSPRCLLHRLILNFPKGNVDHANGNKLDNTRGNLRICNQSQNTANARKRKTNKSGYKGVSLDNRNPNYKWVANLTKNYKHIYVGAYKTKEQAAKAYNERALGEFGEFANLNKI